MRVKKHLSLTITLVFFYLASNSNLIENPKIEISVLNSKINSDSNPVIIIKLLNHSNDTIIVPKDGFKYYSSLVSDSNKLCCGYSVDYAFPTTDNYPNCNYSDFLLSNYFLLVIPKDSLTLKYKLSDLGYSISPRSHESKTSIEFFISLAIPDEFKKYCEKIWTGRLFSEKALLLW